MGFKKWLKRSTSGDGSLFGKKFDQFVGGIDNTFKELQGGAKDFSAQNTPGVSNILFDLNSQYQKTNSPGALPSRNDIVTGILNQQLETLKKRQTQGGMLGGDANSSPEATTASSQLFGV